MQTIRNLVFSFGFCAFVAVANAQALSDRPFSEKHMAAPHVHVETPSQFQPWSGGSVAAGNYDSRYFERTRIGTVILAPGVRAHLDAIRDTVNFPSYFELVEPRSGAVLGTFAVFELSDAEWYFAGNGAVYLNQRHLGLCGPRYTRKFSIAARQTLVEVIQPLIYVGAETEVRESTPLFESPLSKSVVATVPAKSKVIVVGVQSSGASEHDAALLIKTPFGLTGWHRRKGAAGEGNLEIYQCN